MTHRQERDRGRGDAMASKHRPVSRVFLAAVKDLRSFYRSLESKFTIKSTPHMACHVVPDVAPPPIHGWFKLKEGFASTLLASVRRQIRKVGALPTEVIVDPYCGVGTSLVSGQFEPGVQEVAGIEVNPFLHFVAHTKASWEFFSPHRLRVAAQMVAERLAETRPLPRPRLSTFSNPRSFSAHHLDTLLRLRAVIDALEQVPEKRLLLVALAGVIEPASNLRKDGRALRFVQRQNGTSIAQQFLDKCIAIADDLDRARTRPVGASALQCILGDGRDLRTHLSPEMSGRVGLFLYSPPYLNNIDYTEVYKLEAWLLGFFGRIEEFTDQRRHTFRSHPSVRFDDLDRDHDLPTCHPVGDALEHLKSAFAALEQPWRGRLTTQYLSDLLQSLREQRMFLADGGWLAVVIGNSFHGPNEMMVPIATDLLAAALIRHVGLEVHSLNVVRHVGRRRRDHLARETLILARK